MTPKKIAIIGATGAVGKEIIHCLHSLQIPVHALMLIASEKSEGKIIQTPFGNIRIEILSESVFQHSDIAIFAAGSEISKKWKQRAINNNCLLIDNSSAFRYEMDTPLIIPEINPQQAFKNRGVIANPNCTTAIAAIALHPLHKEFGLKKVFMSTYQATSGAGEKGMQELVNQTKEFLNNKDLHREHFAHQIAFNIIPHIDEFQENGYTKEEMKVVWELRKILDDNEIEISCTAVRIPTHRAHSESISIETIKPITAHEAREIWKKSPGISVVDDPRTNSYPMPIQAAHNLEIHVGRIRQHLIFKENGLEFFLSGDQLLKGAALNAVQIVQLFTNQ
jgi:aspartate-semialdehyde dehydrogenase